MQPGKIRRYLKHGTLTQLRVFEAVVRHGGYTRAAAELNLAQPTVSVQIKKLAETAGAPLLEPSGRRVRPTAAGRALYQACLDLFATLSTLEDVLAGLRVSKDPATAHGPHDAGQAGRDPDEHLADGPAPSAIRHPPSAI